MNQFPKLSIITVCKNAAQSIEKTIQSVLYQNYTNIEYLILEGNSDDDTMKIISKYSANCQVFSESDAGIYEAMNKGIQKATGDIITFLNAGDFYFSQDSVAFMMQHLRLDDCEVFFGNIIWIDTENKCIISSQAEQIKDRIDLFHTNFPHPATFYKRELFFRIGFFDTQLKILADYQWNLKALLEHKIPFQCITTLVAAFSTGGISTNPHFSDLLNAEYQQIRTCYFSPLERKYFDFFKHIATNSLPRKLLRKFFRLHLPRHY